MGNLLLVFFVAAAAALHARSAVADGALNGPVYGCLDDQGASEQEKLIDRAFVRAVQQHENEKNNSSWWHLQGAFAFIGVHLAYSEETRRDLLLPRLRRLPVCPTRE